MKKIATLLMVGALCLSLMISAFAANTLTRQTGTIPGTDIQYEYIENVTVQIPDSVETFNLVNVSAEVGYSVERYYGADYQEFPHYRFAFLGENGSVKINQDMEISKYVHTLMYDEEYGYYDDGGLGDMTAFAGDSFTMRDNDGSEKEYISLASPVRNENGEIVAVVQFYMGTYFEQSDEELTNTFVPDEWEKIDISTLAIIDEAETKYTILDGANSIWSSSSAETLSIRADGEFSKFAGVKVDGALVDNSNYIAKEGSTIVEFKADYLKTLEKGKHTVTVVFTDGEVSTDFEIKTATSNVTDVVIPNTSVTVPTTVFAVAIAAISLTGVVLLTRKRKCE